MLAGDKVVVSKLKKITVISAIFMIIEILGGYYSNSIAIFADAFHLLSDVLAYIISLAAVLMSYHPSPKGLTFGYEKLQPLGALLNVSIIWFVTAELFIQATHRITHKSIVQEPTYMLVTSIFGLLCNLYILNILHTDPDAGGHHNCSHAHHKNALNEHQHHEVHQHDHHDHHDDHEHQSNHSHHEHGSNCSHNHQKEAENHHDHDHHDHHSHQKCKGKHSHHQVQHHQKQHEPSCLGSESSARECCSTPTKTSLQSTSSIMKDEVGLPSLASDEQMHSNSQNFHNNINMEAAYIHILTDIILSIGVIVSATIIYFFAPDGNVWSYWQIADPICTYLFSFLAIYSTIPIVKESLVLLLDGCSNPGVVEDIERALGNNPNVKKVVSLRVWSTNRGKNYGALRARVSKGNKYELMTIFSSRKIEGYVHLQEQQELTATQE